MMKEDRMFDSDRTHKPMDDYPHHWFEQYGDGELTQEELYTLMCEFRQQAQARRQAEVSPDKYPNIKRHIEMLESADKRDSRAEIASTGAVDLAEYV